MAQVHPRVTQAMEYFQSQGFTKEQSAGIVGNLMTESYQSIDPAAFNSAGGGRGAMGIAQWRGPRITAFEERYGKTQIEASFEQQLDFISYEFATTEKNAAIALKTAQTPQEAAIIFEDKYERSGGSKVGNRINNAVKAYESTGSYTPAPTANSAGDEVANATPKNPLNPSRTTSTNVNDDIVADEFGFEDQSAGGTITTTANDDAKPALENVIQSEGVPQPAIEFGEVIVPQANYLSRMPSYTYSISWYMMSKEDVTQFLTSERRTLTSAQLICQSAGVNEKTQQRNEWFDLDFYIEDLSIDQIIGMQSAGTPNQVSTISFNVLEPQGISFINRLTNAITAYNNDESSITTQTYLMVIRFYGFDEAGNRITASELGLETSTTDPYSAIEKYIPFQIAQINYKISSQVTEYAIEGYGVDTALNFSTSKATIPFNLQLVAKDVQTLLNGEAVNVQGSGLNNGAGTISQGLCAALNAHQRKLVEDGFQDVADEYIIELENVPGLIDATLVKPGRPDKKNAATNNELDASKRYLGENTSYDKSTRTFNVLAGTQIVDLIDIVMRNSSYIASQQLVAYDEKTGQLLRKETTAPFTMWYRVRATSQPISWDNKRQEYAYRIKYKVTRYQINSPLVAEFPASVYRGTHKVYDWVFTGQNTEILDFEINVNSQFFITHPGDPAWDPLEGYRPPGRFPVKRRYGTPGQSQQGGTKGSSLPAANLSDRLYSMADIAENHVRIVGDPDWIMQAQLYFEEATLTPYLPQGGINSEASEVLYEIRFNPPQDYDMQTGLTPVYENNQNVSTTAESNVAQENMLFACATVAHYFRDGRFEQSLNGYIREFSDYVDAPPELVAARQRGAMPDLTEIAPKAVASSKGIKGLQPGVNPMKVAGTQISSAISSVNNGLSQGLKVFSASSVGQVNPVPVMQQSEINEQGFIQATGDDNASSTWNVKPRSELPELEDKPSTLWPKPGESPYIKR